MKVSVIIPVYNVKPYLERCVQSVLQQTCKDLEIIMVDDGSTDGSGELADSLKALSPCIQVVHQENQGLSGARNTGIRNALGEYVVFLDSDDEWILPDGLETLLQDATQDLIVFKPVDIWKHGLRENTPDYDVDVISALPDAPAVFRHLILTGQFRMSACMLLVRRQLLVQHELFFPLGYISEDVIWSPRVWQCARSVAVNNLDFYGYYHREGSISKTKNLLVYTSYEKIFAYWKKQCEKGCVNGDVIMMYMATLWVSIGYTYYQLSRQEKVVALSIMKNYKGFLEHPHTSKIKRTKLLVHCLGVRNTLVVLGWYWRLRIVIKKHVV